jgi:predicted transcriptional regulator of viral defense system
MTRTVGTQTARLLAGLYDRSRSTFTLSDVQAITGLRPAVATGLVNKAIHRGLFSRLKSGLYVIIPPELGSHSEFAGNPLLVAQQIASGVLDLSRTLPPWRSTAW